MAIRDWQFKITDERSTTGTRIADPKLDYKRYPRSESWQMASVLNPSLQNSLPASQQSKHAREKRERSDAEAPIKIFPAASWKPWQEEEGLPLPPQYVSPDALCKAMPKYMRVKARSDKMRQAHNATTLTTTTSATSDSRGNHPENHSGNHQNLPFSPHIDFAVGSPRSEYSSVKLTPRSVLNSPKQEDMVTSDAAVAPLQQAIKLATSAGCSSASPARSPGHSPSAALVTAATAAPESTTPPVNAPHQNTPQTQATSGSCSSLPRSPSASRRHRGAQSPRIRSAATSPMHPCSVAEGGGSSSRGQVTDPTSLQLKVNSTIAQQPELLQRVVPQVQSAAQGSPLSPANSSVGRESHNHNHHCDHHHSACNYSPPVALPPTPPTSGRQHRQRRTRNLHPQEPTLETYQKISPNTYATNTVWNDRRDQESRDRDQTHPRCTILIKSN